MIYKKVFSEKDKEIGELWIKINCKEELKEVNEKENIINCRTRKSICYDNLDSYGKTSKKK